MGFLAGKRLVITGLLSNRSIAYGIARACHREGAELAFSYVGERFRDRIVEFAKEFGSDLVFDCDVGSDTQIDAMFEQLGQRCPNCSNMASIWASSPTSQSNTMSLPNSRAKSTMRSRKRSPT